MAGTIVEGTLFEISDDNITFETLGCVTDWDLSRGTPTLIDTTCTSDTEMQNAKGLRPKATLAVSVNYDQDGAGRAIALASYADDAIYYFKVTYSDAIVKTFTGKVLDMSEAGAVDDIVKETLNIQIESAIAEA